MVIAGSEGMGGTAAEVKPPVGVLVATRGWQMGVNEPEMESVGKPGMARGLEALVGVGTAPEGDRGLSVLWGTREGASAGGSLGVAQPFVSGQERGVLAVGDLVLAQGWR